MNPTYDFKGQVAHRIVATPSPRAKRIIIFTQSSNDIRQRLQWTNYVLDQQRNKE